MGVALRAAGMAMTEELARHVQGLAVHHRERGIAVPKVV